MVRNLLGNLWRVGICLTIVFWQEGSSHTLARGSNELETTTVGSGCDGYTCPPDKFCKLDSMNRPSCVCRQACNLLYSPVCGSDNKTYDNVCFLRVAACMTNSNITIVDNSQCKGSTCDGVTCSSNKHCIIDEKGSPSCVCNEVCSRIYEPVCGTDNTTYSNKCELQRIACVSNTNITVLYTGECGQEVTCDEITCSGGKVCILDENKRPSCVCQAGCPKIYRPVCGSDGRTYGNECELEAQACVSETNITVINMGRCSDGSGCDGYTCPPDKECQLDSMNRPSCVCRQVCYLLYAPVCGSDDKTYDNDCFLEVAACMTNKNITIVGNGPCHEGSSTVTLSSTPSRPAKKPKCRGDKNCKDSTSAAAPGGV